MKRKQTQTAQLYPILMFSMLLLALLVLIAFSTSVYSHLESDKTAHTAARTGLAYLVTQVRGADAQDAIDITLAQDDGRTVLVLRDGFNADETAEYATRIYLYDGYLVEDYARADTPLAPDAAQKIVQTDNFTVEYLSEQLLCFTTQQGSARVALRSVKEGAQ
ncbi:MAG: DUF4860 domain-containing protein [Ruthenibacterium sp.]